MSARNWQIPGLVCIAAGLAYAQQGNVAGPVSGIVFDRASRQLRPVLGIPGASLLGDPIVLEVEAASAWVAPLQTAAFVASSDGKLHWFRFDAGRASETPIGEGAAAPQAVIFSPSGTAAVLVSGNRAHVIKGLPDAPAAGGRWNCRPDMLRARWCGASFWQSAMMVPTCCLAPAARSACLACPARIANSWIPAARRLWPSAREGPTGQWSIPEVRAWCFSAISRGREIRKR